MGLLKDIADVINDLKNDIKDMGTTEYAKRLRGSSIARKGAEGTLQFPVIVSRSLSIDDAMMICKALERQYASFTQIALSLNPYLDLSRDKDIASYLKNFHQNSGGRFNTLGDLLMENSYSFMCNDDEEVGAMFFINEGANPYIVKNNNDQMFSCMDYINENCLNDLYKPAAPKVNFNNPDLNNFFNNRIFDEDVVMEAPSPIPNTIGNRLPLNQFRYNVKRNKRLDNIAVQNDEYNKQRDRIKDLKELNKFKYQQSQDELKQRNWEAEQRESERRFELQNMGNTQVRMTDNDCKKANEMVPTTLAVSVNVKDNGNFGGTVNFVIGIKTILHPVTSDEMVRNVVNGCRHTNKFFNFIRWTTGELTFIKDFVLNIDEIKDDVVNRMSAKESGWWSVLKHRKKAARAKKLLPIGKEMLPNSTIVMSLDEVEMIKSQYGFDLSDPDMMIKLMREYFLLAFVIVDPAQELATFMYDGQNQPQVMSYAGLERENSNKNDFKEIYKMINSGRI